MSSVRHALPVLDRKRTGNENGVKKLIAMVFFIKHYPGRRRVNDSFDNDDDDDDDGDNNIFF